MLNLRHFHKVYFTNYFNTLGWRSFLSEAYSCENTWQKRLTKPPLKEIKMDKFFIDVDKKFQTKRLASGVHIDMFANAVTEDYQLEELEHLLYRFRKTKRANEMMDSTHHAVVKAFLKFEDIDSLFRILSDQENYGVFPDFHSYNLLMDTFLKREQYRDAAEIAILMMLQEDFSNSISRILSLHSCYQFLKNGSLDKFWQRTEPKVEEEEEPAESTTKEQNDDDEEEDVVYIRIPHLRNPWSDDHFDIKDPKLLIGKTLYLVGREEDNVLGRTSQILGLSLYGKWDKALKILESISNASSPVLLEEGVSKINELLAEIPDENAEKNALTQAFKKLFLSLQQENKIGSGDIISECKKELERIPKTEISDISAQQEIYSTWEEHRQDALREEEKDIDKERRLKIIAEKKEELYWKEKMLFYFEKKEEIDEELEKVNKIIEEHNAKTSAEDTYIPPEIIKRKPLKISQLRKKAMVKKL